MRRWQDEFSRLPIHATLKILEEAANADYPIDDPSLVAERTRFIKIIAFAKKTISSIDPDIAPVDILNSLNSQINQSGVANSVKNFAANGNAAHFVDANLQITSSLAYLYQLDTSGIGRRARQADYEATSVAFERLVKRLDQKFAESASKLDQSLSEITAARQDIEALQKDAKASSAQFGEKIREWTALSNENISAAKAELADVLSRGRIGFNEALAEVKSETTLAVQEFFAAQAVESDEKQAKLSLELEKISSDANAKHKEILRFYDLVAHDSVTGGHKNVADRELIAAENWRRAAVGSIFVTVVWLACALLWLTPQLNPERLFWLQIGKSIGLTALLVSFSIYASKQSTLHRANEQRAREFFLQVQAFDPFIAPLPEEQRWAMKTAMTERIFQQRGQNDSEATGVKDSDFKGFDQVIGVLERIKGLFGLK